MHEILNGLSQAESIIIAGHIRPDGDCVGSCLGMYHYIRDNYPQAAVSVRLEEVPDAYRIIPGSEQILTDCAPQPACDLFIALDCSEKERLGKCVRYFDQARATVCIDHHISNPGYADQNLIEAAASSASEVLCSCLDEEKIGYEAAYALYAGMICDSGVFKYSSTSRRTMDTAGMLMEKGIPFTQIIDTVFYERTYLQARVLGYCLQKSTLSCGGALIWCSLSREEMDSFGVSHADLEGVVAQMKLTKGTEAAAFLTATPDGRLRISLRSAGKADVRRIAEGFGGGGHILAAGATTDTDAQEAIRQIEEMLTAQLS